MSQVQVGFLGVGRMGSAMARRLRSLGFPVVAYDREPERVAALRDLGVVAGSSPAEVARQVDILCSSLPDGAAIQEAFLGAEGALAAARPGTVVLELSTTLPEVVKELSHAASQVGVQVVDAPVSGGPAEAAAGNLVVLAAGPRAALEQAAPVLRALGGEQVHEFPTVGQARVVKLVNNLMTMGNVLVAAEAFVLGVKAGVAPDRLFALLSHSGGRSHHFLKRFPKALAGDFRPGFTIDLGVKDMRLAQRLAEGLGVSLPAAALICQLYVAAASSEGGDQDIVAVLRFFERLAKITDIPKEEQADG